MDKSIVFWKIYLYNGEKWSKVVKEGAAMLLGEYEHALDPKGRIAVPAKLREALGGKFIITKGLDGCLFVYDLEQWQLLEAKLASLPMSRKTARDFTRFLFGGACECECDKQGIADECQVDDFPCGPIAPYLSEDIPEHVGEGECDGSCIEKGE